MRLISRLGPDTRKCTACDRSHICAIDRRCYRLHWWFWWFKRVGIETDTSKERSVASCDRYQGLCDRSQSRLLQRSGRSIQAISARIKVDRNARGPIKRVPNDLKIKGFDQKNVRNKNLYSNLDLIPQILSLQPRFDQPKVPPLPKLIFSTHFVHDFDHWSSIESKNLELEYYRSRVCDQFLYLGLVPNVII